VAYTCSVTNISDPQYGLTVGYRTDTYALVTYLRVGIIVTTPPKCNNLRVCQGSHPQHGQTRWIYGHTCQTRLKHVLYTCHTHGHSVKFSHVASRGRHGTRHQISAALYAAPYGRVPRGLHRGTVFDTHWPNASKCTCYQSPEATWRLGLWLARESTCVYLLCALGFSDNLPKLTLAVYVDRTVLSPTQRAHR